MPGFGINQSSGPPNTVETHRAYRYILSSMDKLQPFVAFAKSCERPSIIIDTMIVHHGQDEISVPGKQRWNPITIEFYDMPGISSALNDWAQNNTVHVSSSTTGQQSQYKKNFELSMLNGAGSPIWVYHLYDAWPSSVKPSKLSYEDTSIATIEVILQIIKCTQTK